MALQSLTYADLVHEITQRLSDEGKEYSKNDVKNILKAFQDETIDCIASGYKVAIPGFARFEARFTPAKKKGELVRNPMDGTTNPRAEGVPARFKVKAFASSSLAKRLPSLTTKQGKDLKAALGA